MKVRPIESRPVMRDDNQLIADALRVYAASEFTRMAVLVKRYADAGTIGNYVGEAIRCVALADERKQF